MSPLNRSSATTPIRANIELLVRQGVGNRWGHGSSVADFDAINKQANGLAILRARYQVPVAIPHSGTCIGRIHGRTMTLAFIPNSS